MAEPTALEKLHAGMKAAVDFRKYNQFSLFKAYPKQTEFFDTGSFKAERMFNAGNQLGKSEAGAFETTCHLTGDYPDWWLGHRFTKPIKAWAAGLSALATRDISQAKLCGDANVPDSLGTGLIPLNRFKGQPTLGRGVTGAYDMIQVEHRTNGVVDGVSILWFKSYEQGWEKFQGSTIDFIWLDEEPSDIRVYSECLTRTVATNGLVIITFTPLSGETELYMSFERGDNKRRAMINMTADEVLGYPDSHLTKESYDALVQSWPRHERLARRLGIPIQGKGLIFPFEREQVEEEPWLRVPGHFKALWAIDFGDSGEYSHPFGAVLGLYDQENDILHIHQAFSMLGAGPINHAFKMKGICAAAPVAWPHDGHRTEKNSGKDMSDVYKGHGLRMCHSHAVFKEGGYSTEAGVLMMDQRLATGKMKVNSDLKEWWSEFRSYHRDVNGNIVKVRDDLMSATRILCMSIHEARVVPMGNLDGRHWKDAARRSEASVATGLDLDPWTGR